MFYRILSQSIRPMHSMRHYRSYLLFMLMLGCLISLIGTVFISYAQTPFPALGEILFSSNREGTWAIYRMSPKGENLKRLTLDTANNQNPVWSPDGKHILYESDRDGNSDIFMMNADGTTPINLTQSPTYESFPSWSSDGQSIIYSLSTEGLISNTQSIPTSLAVMSLRDAEKRFILLSAEGKTAHLSPMWSPDNQAVVFASNMDGQFKIYTLAFASKTPQALTPANLIASNPAYSPDGKRIVFQAYIATNKPDIYWMNADGSGLIQATNDPAADTHPVWSADGKQIGFNSDRTGNQEIYRMMANGSAIEQLTQSTTIDIQMNCNWALPGSNPPTLTPTLNTANFERTD